MTPSYRDLYMVKQREFAIVSISLVRVFAVFFGVLVSLLSTSEASKK
ncbi:unnamed protein product [Chondrus crispus]|uniref:Uncharacterized protein n=1 Tax=Chondrus crispus TaxID=2769 RepID=R7QMD1_CHOCR|nr:unnamed protein product [Chondrus crispus]CDF39259.1 unnamed protein product [Chondrus crispus]|eukprot:XP_005719170.1 unnamed protein product [Chondrus crispus]